MIEVSDELYLHMTGEHLYKNRSELQEGQEDTTGKWAMEVSTRTTALTAKSHYNTHLFVDDFVVNFLS